jgi:SSS family solute:Na+ symporter
MVTVTSFVLYTAFVGLVAYLATRHDNLQTADGYFLASRSLGGWVIAGSLVMTNLSTEHLIGLNADAYRHTIAVMAWETTAVIAMVLMAIYFLPIYLSRGLTTIPQFLADRYDDTTQLIASVLLIASYVAAILPIVLLFGATGLESLFDVSTTWGVDRQTAIWVLVWGVGLLGSVYAIFGGLKAVAVSDTANGVGFLIVGLAIPFLALRSIGDGSALAGLQEVYRENPGKFDITGDEPGSFLPFDVLFTGMIVNQVYFWCTNQTIVQRTFGAKSLAEGQKGVLLAAFFKLLGPLVIVLPGVIAFHLFHSELGDAGAMLAYPRLVKHVLPPVFTGFVAAVMVGAILSTFNSVLNSAATLFSENIYHRLLGSGATDEQLVRAGRYYSIALALAAMSIAPLIDTDGSLFARLQQINATFFGPMLAVVLLGMFTRWATPLAAKLALVLGPIAFYTIVFGLGDQVQFALKSVLGISWDMHFLHFLALVFVATVLGMVAVSFVFPTTIDKLPERAQHVDMQPWPYVKHVSVALVVATIACYWALAL